MYANACKEFGDIDVHHTEAVVDGPFDVAL